MKRERHLLRITGEAARGDRLWRHHELHSARRGLRLCRLPSALSPLPSAAGAACGGFHQPPAAVTLRKNASKSASVVEPD